MKFCHFVELLRLQHLAYDLQTVPENVEFGVAEQTSVGLSGLDIFFIFMLGQSRGSVRFMFIPLIV